MSRSNPTENNVNPCQKWMEWQGQEGILSHYDKATKKQVKEEGPQVFILLDQLATIKGWHDSSESGIYSNEVKDTRTSPFVVKAFKSGVLCEGIYAAIKERVAAVGGHFVTSLYVAFRQDDRLAIGNIQFKGAALREWMEFSKQHRGEIYARAIAIEGYTEGKKGSVTYRVPVFKLRDITKESNEEATALDKTLQTYLNGYLARPTAEKVEDAKQRDVAQPTERPAAAHQDIAPDDIPF
jgi:hypothetical protein